MKYWELAGPAIRRSFVRMACDADMRQLARENEDLRTITIAEALEVLK